MMARGMRLSDRDWKHAEGASDGPQSRHVRHPQGALFGWGCVLGGLLVATTSCKAREASPEPGPTTAERQTSPRLAPSAVVPFPSATATPPPASSELVLEGYLPMHVFRVVQTPRGNAVLLQNEADARVLPIFVGGTEALAVDLRHASRRYPRPLTHDLFDNVVDKLGGRVIKVHVDSLKDNVFIGRVFVRQGNRVFDVDARPSDAIALALGARVPILVARGVLDEAGMRMERVTPETGDAVPEPLAGHPEEPTQL